jgi:hypothetical protein
MWAGVKGANCCYYEAFEAMATGKPKSAGADQAQTLAQRLSDALVQERVVPRFVDSYVVEHGRYSLQVHAGMYRDLLSLLQREALLAASAQALEIMSRGRTENDERKTSTMTRKDVAAFRQKFLTALTRQQHWNVSTALDFQSDLQMYENILARTQTRRSRKPFEAANHPFVDRCAFLLDSSFMENARMAASRALGNLETLTAQVAGELLGARPRS